MPVGVRILSVAGAVLALAALAPLPAAAADGSYNPPPSVGTEVEAPGSAGGGGQWIGGAGSRPADGEGDGAGEGASRGGGGGGRPAGPPRHPGLSYEQCVSLLEFSADREACQMPVPGAPPAPPGQPPAPGAPPVYVIDPATLAQEARESVELPLPQPHTSPPEDGFQLVGLETWFWLDRSAWHPVTARAELPGIWAEVTATPTRATWAPGDGRASVACDGPGAPHPGRGGAATDCGHTYLDVGTFTIAVEVTFAVTWRASNGASGTQDPITVSAELPITVEQRQVVIDPD